MNSKKPADRATLEDLHSKLAEAFIGILKDGVKVRTEDGTVESVSPPANYLNVIRQFIKDNDIQAPIVQGSQLGNIVNMLPYAGTEDGDTPRH